MEQIKLTHTHALSSTDSIVGESVYSPASALVAIDERLITDEVLGVQWGYRKGVRCIVKDKGKVFTSSYLTLSSGSQSQATEE